MTLLGIIADALDAIFIFVTPEKRPQRSITPLDVNQLSNEEILEPRK